MKKNWLEPKLYTIGIEKTEGGPAPLDINDGPHYDEEGNQWWGGTATS